MRNVVSAGRDFHVLDRVVAVRDDVPGDRDGCDPDLDEVLGRGGLLGAGHDGVGRKDAARAPLSRVRGSGVRALLTLCIEPAHRATVTA